MLNPTLYNRLQQLFGDVKISNPNCPGSTSRVPDWNRGGRLKTRFAGLAEQYAVNCPFCGDQRHRLFLHHGYGEQDPAGGQLIHLAKCFNDTDCLNDSNNRRELWEMISGQQRFSFAAISVPKRPLITIPTKPVAITYPSECQSILDEGISADPLRYLLDRSFYPRELWRRWRVMYCIQSLETSPKFEGRLVAPIYHPRDLGDPDSKLRMVGWIARCITAEGKQKYLMPAGYRKADYLYGLSQVIRTHGPVIVTEGITDVWRLCTNAVALIGCQPSARQIELIARLGQTRPIVVFLDEDAQHHSQELVRTLRSKRCQQVVNAVPPDGKKDVGDCSRATAWNQVALALRTPLPKLGVSFIYPPVSKHLKLTRFGIE